MSVFELATASYTSSAMAINMCVLTGYKVDGDWLVVVESDVKNTYIQLIIAEHTSKRTLLYTDVTGYVSSSSRQIPFGGMQSVSSIQVIPAMTHDHHAHVLVW